MKYLKKIFPGVLTILMGASIIFYGCVKEEYDFNAIKPLILSIEGPTLAPAHGLPDFPYHYSVPTRGGSTFAWSLASGKYGGTIVADPEKPYKASIVFNQSDEDTVAIIQVVETTQGGKVSPVATLNVALTRFCPYNMDDFTGNLAGTATGNENPMTGSKTSNLNELKINGLAGFITRSQADGGYGEKWVNGDGSCVLKFYCGDKITIERQKLGDTDFPDTYHIEGAGTIDPVAKKLYLTYKVFFISDSTSPITTEITKADSRKNFVDEVTFTK